MAENSSASTVAHFEVFVPAEGRQWLSSQHRRHIVAIAHGPLHD